VPSPLSAHVAHVCACRDLAPPGEPVAIGRSTDGAASGEERQAVAGDTSTAAAAASAGPPPVLASTDWYAPRQSRTVVVGGVEVAVRFVGRKGRRGGICITVPARVRLESESWRRGEEWALTPADVMLMSLDASKGWCVGHGSYDEA
jgi:hypothetical protein